MRHAAGVVLACVLAAGAAAGADSLTLAKPGDEAPPFSLPGLDGKREALRVWCGDTLLKPYLNAVKHIVIINFWATYCKPCQKEIPELTAFMKKHQSESVKLFCISIDKEGAEKVRPFVKEKGYTVPVLLDPFARTAQRYGVKSVPALFVISPSGKIYYAGAGFDESVDLGAKLEGVLAKIKAGKASTGNKVDIAGEHVAVQNEAGTGAKAPPPELAPRERWKAVARVECGEKAVDVAKDVGVTEMEVKEWYEELKRVALELWASESGTK